MSPITGIAACRRGFVTASRDGYIRFHHSDGGAFESVVTSESMALRGIGDRPQPAWRPADLIAVQKAASIR